MWNRSLLYLLLVQLLISPSLPRRFFRGNSAARSSFFGRGSRTNHYSGSMSARASGGDHSFRNALLGGAVGAAGGMLAFEAGKALLHSKNGVAAHTSHSRDRRHCSTLMKDNGQHNRTRYVVWDCPKNSYCCGNDCCPMKDSGVTDEDTKRLAVVLGILLLLFLSCCCCCFLAYKCCRSAFDGIIPQSNKQKEMQQAPYSQQYPMQQYPASQGYPQSYPANQGYPSIRDTLSRMVVHNKAILNHITSTDLLKSFLRLKD